MAEGTKHAGTPGGGGRIVLADVMSDLTAMLEGRPLYEFRFHERYRLMLPFEKRLAEVEDRPDVPLDTRAAKIATLLWHKTHVDEADIYQVGSAIADDDPVVRAEAARALQSLLESSRPDDSTKYRLRLLIEHQRARERDPALAFQLEELANSLKRTAPPTPAPPAPRPHNPYVAGPPVRDRRYFFGRTDILDTLRRSLAPGSGIRSIVIQGARRTGKTSLLYCVRDGELGPHMVPVYFDMQSVAGTTEAHFVAALTAAIEGADLPPRHRPSGAEGGEVTSMSRVVRELLGRAGEQAMRALAVRIDPAIATTVGSTAQSAGEGTGVDGDFAPVRRALRDLLQRSGDRAIVLLFDEYEVFQDYLDGGSIARQLQSIVEEEPRLFLVFAGAQALATLKGRDLPILFDGAQHLKISYLRREDARRLIVEPAQGLLEFPDEVIDTLLRLTACHPFYTQVLCQSLFAMATGEGARVVTAAHVERAVVEFVENPAPHLVLAWKTLDLPSKLVLACIAPLQQQAGPDGWVSPAAIRRYLREEKFPVRLGRTEIQETLSTLREQEWTCKREGDRSFRFTMELVRRWILEHRSIWELLEEQRRQVLDRSAGLGRRAAALGLDAVFVIVACGLASLTGVRPVFTIIGYFTISLLVLARTPGMVVVRVRPVSEAGTRPGTRRELQLDAAMLAPWLLAALALEMPTVKSALALAIVAVALLVVNAVMIRFSRRGRGLFDKVTNTVFIAEPRRSR